MRRRKWFVRFWLVASACLLCCEGLSAKPSITIESYPAYGGWGQASGKVTGVADTSQVRVALFIFVPGSGWWTKPTFEDPTVPVQSNGSWSGVVANGGADNTATTIAAYLIPAAYNPCCADGVAAPPAGVTQNALAFAKVFRPDPAQRRILFSGYEWLVKSSTGPVGPGDNYFSDSTESVWVDAGGKLHLKIRYTGGQWRCAEVISVESFGYGTYRFKLASDVSDFDPSVVLGLFTWSNDGTYTHREIDIEFAKWGTAGESLNAQYVIQPYDTEGNRFRWTWPAGIAQSTHWFTWRPYLVSFGSKRGDGSIVKEWKYQKTSAIPPKGDEQARLNLWLLNHVPPSSGQPVEVVIEKFEFEPWSIGIGAKGLSRVSGTAADEFTFCAWGRVTDTGTNQFQMDDGSGQSVLVDAPGHGLETGDYALARGFLSGNEPPSIVSNEALKLD